jgi:RNA polymerase sigma-54 factor
MVLAPRLDQRQSQSLVMTPQLQQAIKLLQYSNLELTEFVEQELEKNPMLERDEGDRRGEEGAASDAEGEIAGETANDSANDLVNDPGGLEDINLEAPVGAEHSETRELDAEGDNTFTNDSGSDLGRDGPEGGSYADAGPGSGGGFDGISPDLEETLSETPSLREHLVAQLGVELDNPPDRMIGRYLIDLVDEAGYMTEDLELVGEALGCDVAAVEAVLDKLQLFDPPGICARNLRECLALQLKDLNRYDPCMEAMLENLEMLADRNLSGLAKVCGVDAEDLSEMIMELKALDPKPATRFDRSVSQPVIPDVLMRPKPGGGWVVELNQDTLPRVLVNNSYHAQITGQASNKDDKIYISEQLQSANWLVKSLHQRATTILRVATELVRQQDMFFRLGVQHLRPLVLRDIADVIEMHESTVSRVTSNKYMATPRGIYELKYFFTSAIQSSSGGEALSAHAVRDRIKTLISEEPPNKILSDDKLVTILKAEGMDIARRTVAKYREALGIGSSVQRRREKAIPS